MKAPEYRIRIGFRIAAIAPSLVLGLAALQFLTGVQLFSKSVLAGSVIALVGLIGAVIGFLFVRVLWTGRACAAVEENGLDDSEIAQYRAEARTHGRLVE